MNGSLLVGPQRNACSHCGYLDWTIEKYGRVTHKESCPMRRDAWHQGDPNAQSAVVTLGKWAEDRLRELYVWAGEQGDDPFAAQVRHWAAARLTDLDAFAAEHRKERP